MLCKHTITKSSTFNVLVWPLIPSGYTTGTSYLICARTMQPTAAAGHRTTFVASVFCHVCLHSNFDISFAISNVDSNTNEKVDISEWVSE